MQGINKTRHEHLVDALLQVQQLVSRENDEYLQEAEEYRTELKTMYQDYEDLLNELAKKINDYEQLYSKIKIYFLGRKLKEIRKEMHI